MSRTNLPSVEHLERTRGLEFDMKLYNADGAEIKESLSPSFKFAPASACEIPVSPEFLGHAWGTVFTCPVAPEGVLLPLRTNQI